MNYTENELTTEEWRDLPGYEGIYQASNLGRIRSVDRIDRLDRHWQGRELKPETDKNGYQRVTLSKDGKIKHLFVHRLVYAVFCGEIPEGLFVNHIDENKENNRISNLNLMTCKENVNWGTRNARVAKANKNHPIRSKPVVGYDHEGNVVVTFPSTKEAGRNGYFSGNVSSCCNGKSRIYKGLIWRYVT